MTINDKTLRRKQEKGKKIIKVVTSLKEYGLLIKGITLTIENKTKEQKVISFLCF